ncbi:MAG: hypothetical protein ACR2OE_05675 [Thermomicrobiales bacterium]
MLSIYGVNGLTAYFGMIDIGRPVSGETVLVTGAAGGVGLIAGQIAKALGCQRMRLLPGRFHPPASGAVIPPLAGMCWLLRDLRGLVSRHPLHGAVWQGLGGWAVPRRRAKLRGQVRDDLAHLGEVLGLRGQPPLLLGKPIALLEDDPDQLIAGRMVEIKHGPILRLPDVEENPSPKSE